MSSALNYIFRGRQEWKKKSYYSRGLLTIERNQGAKAGHYSNTEA